MNKKIKMLVVDDSSSFRESINVCLHDQNTIQVVGLVASGIDCLDFVNKNSVDLVLMDARMSGLDGPQTTQKLKQKHSHTKVIICTIWDEKEARNYALNSGADDYFVKGEPISTLIKKIHTLFSK